jgi:two-component system cell cycle response regulator DivK
MLEEAQGRTILVAGQDRQLRIWMSTFASVAFDGSAHVLQAKDGREALRIAAERQPHLVLVKEMLPKISGPEVCRLLRQAPKTSRIKIILVSRSEPPPERRAHADAYLVEPFGTVEFVHTLRQLVP